MKTPNISYTLQGKPILNGFYFDGVNMNSFVIYNET